MCPLKLLCLLDEARRGVRGEVECERGSQESSDKTDRQTEWLCNVIDEMLVCKGRRGFNEDDDKESALSSHRIARTDGHTIQSVSSESAAIELFGLE